MRVLGIDPGTGRCGFGVVEKRGNQIIPINYGVIETFKDQSDLERLNIVYEGIGELIATYRPEFMGVETLYFNTNITTGIKVAQARGVILLAGYRQNVPIIPVTPLQVKQQMAGYGRATKKQVIEMVMRMMNITRKIDPDDAADALAIGLTAIYHVELFPDFQKMHAFLKPEGLDTGFSSRKEQDLFSISGKRQDF